MATRKIIIDTDPGVDDAVAILLALASSDLDVLGLTTVFGNAHTELTTRNALVLLEAAGRPDIPVAMGAAKPLVTDYLGPVPQVHGANGLGDAPLTTPTIEPIEAPASDFLWTTVAAHPGEVTIVALGPLTNLALALQQHPGIAELVDQVIVMGGNALVPGNATPVAEANINNDPEAADLVFGADWSVTMVGLDVTHEVNLTGEMLDRLGVGDSGTTRLLRDALPSYRAFYQVTFPGVDGIFVHDPSTIAYLLDPGAFTTQAWPLRVETESFSRGKTWPNMGNTDDPVPPAWQGRPTVDVCTAVEGARVTDLILGLLTDSSRGPRSVS